MNLSQDRNGFLAYKTNQDQIFEAKRIFTERFSSSLSLNSKTVYDRMESRLAGIVGEIVYQELFPFRKNYAGIGYFYDEIRDAFIPPKPYQSWILNEDTCLWESPVEIPDDGKKYIWNEEYQSWIEIS